MGARGILLTLFLVVGQSTVIAPVGFSDELQTKDLNPNDQQRKRDEVEQRDKPMDSPVLVMLQHDHWIGEDTTFALYANGRVIFAPAGKRSGSGGTLVGGYLSVVLTQDELRSFRRRLKQVGFFDLQDSYTLSDWTCQPTATIYGWRKGRPRGCCVYGDLSRNEETRTRAPQAFLELFDELTGFAHDRAEPWMPEHVEVMLSSPGFPTFSSKDDQWWPNNWPHLTSSTTKRNGDDYRIYLPSKRFNRLETLCRKHHRYVDIDGKAFRVAYRFPLPQERMWFEEHFSGLHLEMHESDAERIDGR